MNRRNTLTTRRAQSGFTLVELLTAVALLTIMLLMAFQILDNAIALTGRGRALVDVTRNARQALKMLRQDLEGAVIDDRGFCFIYAWDGGPNDDDGTVNGSIQLDELVDYDYGGYPPLATTPVVHRECHRDRSGL